MFLTVKNSSEFVEESIKLPKPNKFFIECHTPSYLKWIKEYIPKNIIAMVNSGNTDMAIDRLNCNVANSSDSLVKSLRRNYETAIENKKIEKESELKKKVTNHYDNVRKERTIKKIDNIIQKIEKKIKDLDKIIIEDADDLCSICLDEINNQTFVSCCSHNFCFECITLMVAQTSKCPLCQKRINDTYFNVVGKIKKRKDDIKEQTNTKKLDKMDELLNIINKNKDGRILVFSDFGGTFTKISDVLTKKKIEHIKSLGGTGKQIEKSLDEFRKGKKKILMLNAHNFGAGMNLFYFTDFPYKWKNKLSAEVKD